MAVLSVKETFDGRESFSEDGRSRDYTRVFVVETDSITDWELSSILDAADPSTALTIPQISESLPGEPTMIVRSVRWESTDNPLIGRAVVRYSTQSDFAGFSPDDFTGDPDFIDNPLARPANVSFSFVKEEVAAEFAYDRATQLAGGGNGLGRTTPVLNSASQPFDPPITTIESYLRMTWVQNFSSFPITEAWLYADAVNDDQVFLGSFPILPFTGKVDSITGNSIYESGSWYWQVTYTIDFRFDRWIPTNQQEHGPGVFYDTGRAELVEDPPMSNQYKNVVITDGQGYSMSEPVPLDGQGRLKTTLTGNQVIPAKLRFSLYKVLPFASLAIF